MSYGSFNNLVMDGATTGEGISVGMKATILMYTDRYPGIVTEVLHNKNGSLKGVYVQELEFKCQPFPSGYAEEIYMDRPKGEPRYFPVTTRGKKKGRISGLLLGKHDAYIDPHF